MKKIIFVILINHVFSKVNFEILNIPHNIYSFTVNEYSINEKFDYDKSYSLSVAKYPANISYISFSNNNNFSFRFLDYGVLYDQINDDILNSFSAYELFVEYKLKRNISSHFFYIKPSIVHSKIDSNISTAIFCNLSFLYNNFSKGLFFNANINNIGLIIDDYLLNNNSVDLKYSISTLKNLPLKNIELGFNFIYYDFLKDYEYSLSINKKISDRILFIFNYSSTRKKLNKDHMFTNIFSGLSSGIVIKNNFYNLGIGIQSLSNAGYSYCMTLDFK